MESTGERYIPGSLDDSVSNGIAHWQRYLFARNFVDGKRILDIACGEGYGSDSLAEGATMVYGVDISEEAIEHASQKYRRENLRFLKGSVDRIPLPDHSVDVVICFETIEHVSECIQLVFLNEVKRVLTHEGILIVSCPNEPITTVRAKRLWDYTNEFHVKEHGIPEFQYMLMPFFENVRLFYQRTESVLVLSERIPTTLSVILSDEKSEENTQNIIAVCSKAELKIENLSTAVLDIHLHQMELEESLSMEAKANGEAQALLANINDELQKAYVRLAESENNLVEAQAAILNEKNEAHRLLENINDELQKANVKLAESESNLAKVQVERDEMSALVKENAQKIAIMQSNLDTQNRNHAKLMVDLLNQESNFENLSADYLRLKETNANIVQQKEQQEAENLRKQEQQEAENLRKQEQQEAENLRKQEQLVLAETERLRLQNENNQYKAEIDSLLHSRSWRITKPLRGIKSFFKK